MRRHPQFKHPKMTFKAVRVHAAIAEGTLQVFPVMQALAAGSDFNAIEQQIEALCRSVRSPGCCIEWPTGERKSNNKNRGNSRFLLGKRAQLAFPFRIKIVRQVRSAKMLFQKLKASAEFPCRHVEHRWKGLDSMPPKNFSVRAS